MRRLTLVLLLIVLTSAGCSLMMPPQKIPMDRRNYIDAISTSWKEQLLSNLIRLRYRDTLTFLEMTSVNTSYSLDVSLSAGYSTIWRPLVNTTGWRNAGVIGGSVDYADRPNVSYIPIRGEALAKTLVSPISLSNILSGLQTGSNAGYIFSCCVDSINHLRNRSPSGNFSGDPGFFELYQLVDNLLLNGVLRIATDKVSTETTKEERTDEKRDATDQRKQDSPGKGKSKRVKECTNRLGNEGKNKEAMETTKKVVSTTAHKSDRSIASIFVDKIHAEDNHKLKHDLNVFIKLLELNPNLSEYKVYHSKQQAMGCEANGDIIVMQPRSILNVLMTLSQFIAVPEKDINENRAQKSDLFEKKEPLFYGPSEKKYMFEIKHNDERPRDAFVAMKYRADWFYIPDTDLDSKDIFSVTASILSMSEPGTSVGTPLLTIPLQ